MSDIYCDLCKEDLIYVDAGECKVLRVRRATRCRYYKPAKGVSGSPICQGIGTDERNAFGAFPQRIRKAKPPANPTPGGVA